jgi:glycosyltransferase involved in cell wall biosynthesis
MKKNQNFKKLSIIIPAYNEEKTIFQVLKAVSNLNLNMTKEIIVVDDGSIDNTLKLAKTYASKNDHNATFKVLKNKFNLGKTQTVRKGLLASTGDLVVIQDADLEYEPRDLVKFVKTFEKNPDIDFIYGNRFAKKFNNIYLKFYLGNRFVTFISNLFTRFRGLTVGDMEVCYKMAKGDLFRKIGRTITSVTVFGLEPELTAKFARYRKNAKKLNYFEIPINYRPRTIEEGKKMRVSEGFRAIYEIGRFNLLRNI